MKLEHTIDPQSITIFEIILGKAAIKLFCLLISCQRISTLCAFLVIDVKALPTKMSKPIPLGAALSIEEKNIVIHAPRCLIMHVMIKDLSSKERMCRFAQMPVQRYTYTTLNFFCRLLDALGGKKV